MLMSGMFFSREGGRELREGDDISFPAPFWPRGVCVCVCKGGDACFMGGQTQGKWAGLSVGQRLCGTVPEIHLTVFMHDGCSTFPVGSCTCI